MRNFKPNRVAFQGEAVVNSLPSANFSYVIDGLEITFTDASSDPDGTITDWDWDFGDTNTSTLQNPVHTYAATGTYNVTLVVTDNDLNTAEYSINIKINAVPVAAFSFVDNNDREIAFTDESTDSDGTIVAWSWDFGDSLGTSTSQNPTYTYASAGTYNVVLTVTDNDGATDDITIAVTPNISPIADFTYAEDGLEVTFTDASTDSDGTIASWLWDFDDTNTSTSQNPVHTYASAGTYTVRLTVTDNDGATHFYEEVIIVEEPAPPAFPSIRNMFVSDTFTNNSQEITVFTDDIQETDLLILIHVTDGPETIDAPTYLSDASDAGYGTAIETSTGDDTTTIWAKEAVAGDVGEDVEITWGTIERSVAAMLVIKDHDGIDVSDITNFSGGGATTSPTSPSVTTTVDNCLVIYGLIVDDNNSGNLPFPTLPSGKTHIMHTRNFGGSAGGVMLSLVIEEKTTAGATGTAGWTISAARASQGFTIAVAPGVLGGVSPDLNDGLAEMFDLEDTSAFVDPIGNELELVNSGNPDPIFTTGHIGDCFQSGVLTQYARVPHADAGGIYSGLSDVTLLYWHRSSVALDSGYEGGVRGGCSFGQGNGSGSPYIQLSHRANIDSAFIDVSNGTTNINFNINVEMLDDTWQLYILRVHKKGFMSVQKNKVWYGQRQISSQSADSYTPTTGGFRIGYSATQAVAGAQFDSVMIYHKVLEYDNSMLVYNEGAGISTVDLP